tara:strand:+ start:446 stop:838 length:393 start_codon:yes stop_codon:yes gene_type:complete
MRTFRNNNKRGRFRSNDRNYKRNGETSKFSSDYSSNSNFKRNLPSRNNHNAPKLIEKYNDLAREALSKGDKILSENYFQHADHFTRILAEKENLKLSKEKDNKNTIEVVSDNTKLTSDETENQEKQILKT